MSTKSFKGTVVSIPGVGYLARWASNLLHLPKLGTATARNTQAVSELSRQFTQFSAEQEMQAKELVDKLADIEFAHDSLQQQLAKLSAGKATKAAASQAVGASSDLFADDHIMDKFYTKFEDRFRGSEAEITKRLEEYLPYFSQTKLNFTKNPVLDIGSGRGEFISLLKKNSIKAIGLDINLDMVNRSKKKGLAAEQGEALSYLQAKDTQTYGAITGFHLVEHIPFNLLLRIFNNAHRVLVKGGFVIFETPNPENLIVGSHNFYMDPSHLHPLPPVLMAFALEMSGFKNVEIKRLHPDTEAKTNNMPPDVKQRFYGPRDYAVIGYK